MSNILPIQLVAALAILLFMSCSEPDVRRQSSSDNPPLIENLPQETSADLSTSERVKEEHESNLELVAVLDTPEKIESGLAPEFSLKIFNRSKSKAFRIIKPGDGSEVGWRTPHVYATAEWLNEKNEWKSCKAESGYGRCGNFDVTQEPVELKPGGQFELVDWIPKTCINHEFSKPGKYRVRWHFIHDPEMGKGKARLDASDDGSTDNKSIDIPEFSLVSKPIAFEVYPTLKLELKAKAQGAQILSKPSTTNGFQILDLASLFRIDLKNVAATERELTVPTLHGDARLMLEWYELNERTESHVQLASSLQFTEQKSKEGGKFQLEPNQSVELTGSGPGGNAFGGDWETSCGTRVRVRAMYWLSTWGTPSPKIYSDWVELDLPEIELNR